MASRAPAMRPKPQLSQDGALLVLGDGRDGAQDLLTDLGGGHGRAQHQHQSHLHGEGQQTPEALGIAPGIHQVHRALLSTHHRGHKDHNSQDDGEQERIWKPAVNDPYAAIGKLFEHAFPSLIICNHEQTPTQFVHNFGSHYIRKLPFVNRPLHSSPKNTQTSCAPVVTPFPSVLFFRIFPCFSAPVPLFATPFCILSGEKIVTF